MSNINTGGPAFPFTPNDPEETGDPGMTLRDYFAAKWLQGAAADPSTRNWRYKAEAHAETAYVVADAMLKARDA